MRFKFCHSVLLFTLTLVLLICYLVSTNVIPPPPSYLFWIPVTLLAFLVVWQIGKVNDSIPRGGVILLEIIALGFALNLMCVVTVPYGLFGRDIHHDYYAAEMILQHGWPIPSGIGILEHARNYSEWPAFHLLGGVVSKILGVPLFAVEESFTVTKWLPSIISSSTVAVVYVLVQRVYRKVQVSLLVALGFSMLTNQVVFHSWFVRETLACPLLFLFLYFCARRLISQGGAVINYVLAILCLLTLLFAHHLTSFMLVVLLGLLVADFYLVKGMGKRFFNWSVSALPPATAVLNMMLLAFVAYVSYIMYIGQPVFRTILFSMKALFAPSYETAFLAWERSFREQLILGLNLFFAFVFFILIIIQINRSKKEDVVWDILGLSYGVFAAFLLMAGRLVSGMLVLGGRAEFFGWLFVLFPVAHFMGMIKNKGWVRYIIALFVLFQIFQISPYIYDRNAEPAYGHNQVNMSYSLATYRAVEWFDGSGTAVGDLTVAELFGGLKQAPVIIDTDIFEGELEGLVHYDWLVVRTENFKQIKVSGEAPTSYRLSREVFESYNSLPYLAKVYQNKDIIIYKVQPGGIR